MVIVEVLLGILALAGSLLAYLRAREKNRAELRMIRTEHQQTLERMSADQKREIEKQSSEMQVAIQYAQRESERWMREQIEAMTSERQEQDNKISQLQQDNARHVEFRAEAEGRAEERKSEIKRLLTRQEHLQEQLTFAREKLAQMPMLESMQKQTQSRVDSLEKAIEHERKRNSALIQENREVKEENRSLREKVSRLEREIAELRDALAVQTEKFREREAAYPLAHGEATETAE